MTAAYAGDVLDGSAPRLRAVRGRERGPGLVGGSLRALTVLVGAVVAMLRADPGLIVDVLAAGLVVAGVGVLFGTGWLLVAGGLGLAVVREFGGSRAPTGR